MIPTGQEAERGVGADRALVGGGGVDREAVMPAGLDQVRDHEPQRLAREALAVVRGAQEQVKRRVAVVRLLLLRDEDQARELAARLERERGVAVILEQVDPDGRAAAGARA